MQPNVVQSINGANVSLSDQVLATEVGEPMFFWYGQLLNTAIIFTPVIVVVSMFWFIYWYIKNLWEKKDLESRKSLENK